MGTIRRLIAHSVEIGCLLGILFLFPLEAAPLKKNPDNLGNTSPDLRYQLSELRHLTDNQEIEIRMFEQKLRNQDESVEQLRAELNQLSQTQKDSLKGTAGNFEVKINSLENSLKTIIADFKLIKDHVNETSAILSQYQHRLEKVEKTFETQNQNIANLEKALNALMDAMLIPGGLSPLDKKNACTNTDKTYKVKAGDSLGTIAQKHRTTIRAIKDLNHLPDDKIVVGQTLKLP